MVLLYQTSCTDVAAEEGFEPSRTESESVVLPLHNPAVNSNIYYNKKNENVNIIKL